MTIKNVSLRVQAMEHKTLCTKSNIFQPTVSTDSYFDLGHGSLKYYSSKYLYITRVLHLSWDNGGYSGR